MNGRIDAEADPARRVLMVAGAVTPLLAAARMPAAATTGLTDTPPPGRIQDFDILVGRWRVRHRRLAGCPVASADRIAPVVQHQLYMNLYKQTTVVTLASLRPSLPGE